MASAKPKLRSGPVEANGAGRLGDAANAHEPFADAIAARAAWQELMKMVAAAQRPGAPRDAAAEPAGLRGWLDQHLTADGLFAPAPWSSICLVAPLSELRSALRPHAWPDECEQHLVRLAAMSIRLATGAGTIRGPSDQQFRTGRIAVERLLAAPALRDLRAPARWIWRPGSGSTAPKAAMPGFQSDGADIAVLRRDWTSEPTALAIDYSRPTFDALLCIHAKPALYGIWDLEIVCSGKPLKLQGEWEATCWFADRDGEYIELRRIFGGGIVLERQFYLSRRLPLLIFADTLKSPLAEPVELTCRIPVADAGRLLRESSACSFRLETGADAIRLIPFGWPPATTLDASQFRMESERLTMTVRGVGKRLFAPLAVQWNLSPDDQQKPWTSLTITNDRRRVEPAEAVAFRIPIEDEQIVYFRALHDLKRYAFIGYQTRAECTIGDFDSKGKLHEWVSVE